MAPLRKSGDGGDEVVARFELGIDLGVDEVVEGSQGHAQQVVQVGGESLEAGLVAHEAVDVDQEQGPLGGVAGGGHERHLGRGAGVRGRDWL